MRLPLKSIKEVTKLIADVERINLFDSFNIFSTFSTHKVMNCGIIKIDQSGVSCIALWPVVQPFSQSVASPL